MKFMKLLVMPYAPTAKSPPNLMSWLLRIATTPAAATFIRNGLMPIMKMFLKI
ncbi:MAG: hypothetical protein MJZ78_03890 [Bacteroidales bacterium]|nr:hypothetical protein [Bacteroidales bacterium]